MGRYLDASELSDSECIWKYVFGEQPSEIGEMLNIPMMEETGVYGLVGGGYGDDYVSNILITNPQLTHSVLTDWLFAIKTGDDTFTIKDKYLEGEYPAVNPGSEYFIELIESICEYLNYRYSTVLIRET